MPAPRPFSHPPDAQHGGALEGGRLDLAQGLVRILQREDVHGGLEGLFPRQAQELPDIGPREIGDAAQRPFVVQVPVRDGRKGVHVHRVDGHRAAPAEPGQRPRHHLPRGREGDGGVQGRGRGFLGGAGPTGAERPGMPAVILVAGEDVDRAAPAQGHLEGEMGGGPEAEKPEDFPGWTPDTLRERKPITPAQRRGAVCTGSRQSGSGVAWVAGRTMASA